eukprot:13490223-Heterocapsa_arctica.AAC.1
MLRSSLLFNSAVTSTVQATVRLVKSGDHNCECDLVSGPSIPEIGKCLQTAGLEGVGQDDEVVVVVDVAVVVQAHVEVRRAPLNETAVYFS